MKFLTKINRQLLFTFSVLLFVTGIIGFIILKTVLKNEVLENIIKKEYAIKAEIRDNNSLPNLYPLIETKRIKNHQSAKRLLETVYLEDVADDNEKEPYFEYTNIVEIKGQYYQVKIRQAVFEYDDLIVVLSVSLFSLLVLSLIAGYFINRRLNKSVWENFEINLEKLKNFSLQNDEPLKLNKTDIKEFDQLNDSVLLLTVKLQKDYKALKLFSENASHELQTPLSIILVSLEELLQEDLKESVWKKIANSHKVIKKLSDLNKNLLVLTKIENMQYPPDKEIILNKIIYEKTEDIKPLIESKNIEIDFIKKEKLLININYELASILVSNLMNNAVKHNIENGKILITINQNGFKICNTGIDNNLTADSIFNRFTKENSSSFGLGLAIVEQICLTHNIRINYTKNSLHCFELIKELKFNST